MKRIYTSLLALMLTAVLLSGCALIGKLSGTGPSEPPAQTGDSTPAETAGEASPSPSAAASPVVQTTATVTTETYTYKSDYIDVSIETPVISGLSEDAVGHINTGYQDYRDSIESTVKQLEDESRQLTADGYSGEPYMLNVSYTVDYNKNGVLCITQSDYSYLGGAHGNEIRQSLLFDTATGSQLQLGDLMKDGSDFRSLINGLIRSEIDERLKTGDLVELAVFEDIGDTSEFYLTDEALVFYFQEYEYFPYAAGIQEFPITYETLADLLKYDLAA
jgi:inhibitor of cysteine peptidase